MNEFKTYFKYLLNLCNTSDLYYSDDFIRMFDDIKLDNINLIHNNSKSTKEKLEKCFSCLFFESCTENKENICNLYITNNSYL